MYLSVQLHQSQCTLVVLEEVISQVPGARCPLFGTCTHAKPQLVANGCLEPGSDLYQGAAEFDYSTCLWKGEQLTEYTGPPWGEKASSAGALSKTEEPVRWRAGVSAAMEHFSE